MLLCMLTANEYHCIFAYTCTCKQISLDRLVCKPNEDMWILFCVCTIIVYMVMVMLNQCGTVLLNVVNCLYGKV